MIKYLNEDRCSSCESEDEIFVDNMCKRCPATQIAIASRDKCSCRQFWALTRNDSEYCVFCDAAHQFIIGGVCFNFTNNILTNAIGESCVSIPDTVSLRIKESCSMCT